MPQPSDLPEALQKFCYLNAAAVASGRDFHHQTDRLIRSIDQILGAKAPPIVAPEPIPKSQPRSRRTALIAGGTALAAPGTAVAARGYPPGSRAQPPC